MWLISLAEINEEYRGLRQFYERLEHLNSMCVSSHASVILMCETSYLCIRNVASMHNYKKEMIKYVEPKD